MQPDKTRDRTPPREEHQVAYFTKLLGRNKQRQILQQQVELEVTNPPSVSHGEDGSTDSHGSPPQHDRAG